MENNIEVDGKIYELCCCVGECDCDLPRNVIYTCDYIIYLFEDHREYLSKKGTYRRTRNEYDH